MDIGLFLRRFESSLTSYTGDDPLEQWDRFVEHLEQRLPAEGCSEMSVVFDTLVQRFLNVERYANDIRYVNYCIRCAGHYSDPISLYSHIFSLGIGTRTAALYMAWAQQYEQRGMNEQADAVYQKALENQAQPAETVLHEYRQFQTRTTAKESVPAGGRNPLQNLNLANQPVAQNKALVDCPSKPSASRMTIIMSRSETSGMLRSSQGSSVQVVSEYMTDELCCQGSELCFEEVRAAKYFQKLREQQEEEKRKIIADTPNSGKQVVQNFYQNLKCITQDWEVSASQTLSQRSLLQPVSAVEVTSSLNPSQQLSRPPRPSSRRSVGLRLLTEPAFIHEAAAATASPQPTSPAPPRSEMSHHASVLADRMNDLPMEMYAHAEGEAAAAEEPEIFTSDCFSAPSTNVFHQDASGCQPQDNVAHQTVGQPQEADEKLDASHGGTANLSHLTPNTSLGFVQATPSRALPSPTVNTREALGVIMDMFQAPTFLDEPFNRSSLLHTMQREEFDVGNESVSAAAMPPAKAAFTIFQDDNNKENGSVSSAAAAAVSAAAAAEQSKPARGLCDITASKSDKPNDTPPDLMPDESMMWGVRYNSLHSLAACPNSTTDFAMLAHCVSTPFTNKMSSGVVYRDEESNCDGNDAEDDAFVRRQTKKLSPIIEQSPSEDKLSETSGRLLPSSSARLGTIVGEGLSSALPCLTSSSITMVQPPPPAVLSFRDHTLCSADSGWEVYTSPERPPTAAPETSVRLRSELFEILEDPDPPASPAQGRRKASEVPMSPDCPLNPNWMSMRSPQRPADLDLDAFISPHRPGRADAPSLNGLDVTMSPEQPRHCADVPMSPQQAGWVDEAMTSPDRAPRSEESPALQLVSDPWNNELISQQLSTLTPPLTSHPHCYTWQCDVPKITPKTTISMGKASLQIESIVGEGAFATVYQVTGPWTSNKMVLKVQKPANPWEFYINSQLDARLQPDVRRLFSVLHSAHLFHDGSMLLGELHNYGTLLNTVNIYKALSDKVMPQPLVMYFATCILHMVEQLHSVHIIHADIKPDNFLLGARVLENSCFDPDACDHGLVLIDLGQSIDMDLFPQGTAFTAKCLTSGFQCTEMLSGKPWNYQTDYFGVAATVHCMLFGTYMQVVNEGGVWKTNGVFRRKPHSELWQDFFHTLLNVPHCGALPSLRSLRHQLTAVLQQDYSSKLYSLKNRLLVQLLERDKAPRQ